MAEIELGAVQERFADLVRAHEPIASGELVGICEKELKREGCAYQTARPSVETA